MAVPTTGRTFNFFRSKKSPYKPVNFRGKILDVYQRFFYFLRDDGYYNCRIIKKHEKLKLKILRDTNWLAVTTHSGSNSSSLTFTEQAIEYYKYRNMVIQRRSQYAIIFLTFVLILVTALQIYFKFY